MNAKTYQYKISRDIVYGTGAVRADPDGDIILRNLTLDLYQPLGVDITRKLPILIFAFGGAFHRGTKEDDVFGDPPRQNNSIAWYCQEFAKCGFVTCSIDYRLIPENPVPGNTTVVSDPNSIPRSRMDEVRKLMGLPPADQDLLWRGIEAASDDMRLAVRFVRSKAKQWNIDLEKMVLGGFSAGARTALNVALGENEKVAAVISLSGYMDVCDIERHADGKSELPSLLLIHAEDDLDYIKSNMTAILECVRKRGFSSEVVEVKGATHFYPAHALASHEQYGMTTVEEAIATFLNRTLFV